MKMKRILALLLALMMSLSLVACGGDSGDTAADDGDADADAGTEEEVSLDANDVTTESGRPALTMWFWGAATDYQVAMKDILCTWYNNSQDDYELVIEFRNTVDVDVPRALAAGTAPDIIYASGPSYIGTYKDEDLVLNLDSYAEQYGWKDNILGVIYDSLTLDGSLYSVPGGMSVGGLFYNKELFEEKGWTPPTTLDEMVALMEDAKAAGLYPLGAGNKGWKPCNNHFGSMIINHVGNPSLFYNALSGNSSFNTPEMVAAVEASAEWFQNGYLAGEDYVNLDSQECMQVLRDKRAAMVMAPTLYIQFAAQSFLGDEQSNVGFVPMPSSWTDEAVYDVSINCNFAINAKTDKADECARILDYMLSGEFAGKMTEAWPGYWAVPVKDILTYDSSTMTGLSKVTLEAVQAAVEQIDKGYFAYHPDTFFPSATSTAFQDIDTVWQGVLTAEQFCETVANELDNELDVVVPLTAPAEQ